MMSRVNLKKFKWNYVKIYLKIKNIPFIKKSNQILFFIFIMNFGWILYKVYCLKIIFMIKIIIKKNLELDIIKKN